MSDDIRKKYVELLDRICSISDFAHLSGILVDAALERKRLREEDASKASSEKPPERKEEGAFSARVKTWGELSDSYDVVYDPDMNADYVVINNCRLHEAFVKMNEGKLLSVVKEDANTVHLEGALDVKIPYYALDIVKGG